jgi:AraC-like DNA-binding protein
MQVKELDQKQVAIQSRLKPKDVEILHGIRDYITLNYDQSCTIIGLAKRAGINQMKLKSGFKELFGTTVFGYLSEVRLQEARRLLLDEKLYVGEVSDRIGYKYPQHFTSAFRRRFGILPKELRG